ncbi:MAG: hypothetical protein EAX95_13075 [Candidatus Thorarchaeota archaeon]|nr:hypothetical protein [Candidatus Thorarchaeota archaeon]
MIITRTLIDEFQHSLFGDQKMSEPNVSRNEILQSTLFHIQLKQCQYIDNFPETVADIIDQSIKNNKLRRYEEIKRKLYRIKTNFFDINRNKVKKCDFFESLYNRIARRIS